MSLIQTREKAKAKTIQTRKIEIELPVSAVQVLEEMAIASEQPLQKKVRQMVYSIMECDLTGCGDMEGALAKYLCRKYGYDPMSWRKEED